MAEYTFISENTFDEIIANYLSSLPDSKKEKALINLELLDKIKKNIIRT